MKAKQAFLSFGGAVLLFSTNVASAFSITAVTLSPSNALSPSSEVTLTVDIVTPSQSAWVYAPTQVSSNATGLRIDIFPSSGMLTAIGHLHETVSLGTFPAGAYRYEVILHPDFTVNWGTRRYEGSFAVLPRLAMSWVAQDLVVLRWSGGETNCLVESSPMLSGAAGWSEVREPIVRLDDGYVVSNRMTYPVQFYRLRKR